MRTVIGAVDFRSAGFVRVQRQRGGKRDRRRPIVARRRRRAAAGGRSVGGRSGRTGAIDVRSPFDVVLRRRLRHHSQS